MGETQNARMKISENKNFFRCKYRNIQKKEDVVVTLFDLIEFIIFFLSFKTTCTNHRFSVHYSFQ